MKKVTMFEMNKHLAQYLGARPVTSNCERSR